MTDPPDEALAVVERAPLALPAGLVERAAANAKRPHAPATLRAYARDWKRFEAWCRAVGLRALPADEATICTHLTALAEMLKPDGTPLYRYATIERAYAAIRVRQEAAGVPLGTLIGVRNTLVNVGRKLGKAPRQKAALEREQIVQAAALMGPRDRAILLLGWSIGQRRSNIAALALDDARVEGNGAGGVRRPADRHRG